MRQAVPLQRRSPNLNRFSLLCPVCLQLLEIRLYSQKGRTCFSGGDLILTPKRLPPFYCLHTRLAVQAVWWRSMEPGNSKTEAAPPPAAAALRGSWDAPGEGFPVRISFKYEADFIFPVAINGEKNISKLYN